MYNQNKILFLFARPSGYIRASIASLINEQTSILFVYRKNTEEAPFNFLDNDSSITHIARDSLTSTNLKKKCLNYNPDIVFVSGWSDALYLEICKELRSVSVPVVMGIDNPWKGNLKQRLGALIYQFKLKQSVDFIWGAGDEQLKFAHKLGFTGKRSKGGLYSADTNTFKGIKPTYSKTLLYIGRLIEWKGVLDLSEVFSSLSDEERNGWTINIAGTGSLYTQLENKDHIKCLGFIQPRELPTILENSGAFILPSHDEHWGVVVHEAAVSGLPLILSDKVRAGEEYLEDGKNGYRFRAADKADLRKSLIMLFSCSSNELRNMGGHSRQLGMSYTSSDWAKCFLSFLDLEK